MVQFHDTEQVWLLVGIDSTTPYILVRKRKEKMHRHDSIHIEGTKPIRKMRAYWYHRKYMDRTE